MSTLSPQQAQILLETDLLNLVHKVKNKNTLTARERKSLEAIAHGKGGAKSYVQNQVELAEAIGVHHRTIQNWLRIDGNPGKQADGRYHVPSWREWARVNGRKVEAGPDKSALQAQHILLQNERLQLANEKAKAALIPREMAKQIFTQLVLAAKTRCFAGIPRLVTLARVAPDTTEATEEIRKEFADIWGQLTSGEWYNERLIANDAHTAGDKKIPDA